MDPVLHNQRCSSGIGPLWCWFCLVWLSSDGWIWSHDLTLLIFNEWTKNEKNLPHSKNEIDDGLNCLMRRFIFCCLRPAAKDQGINWVVVVVAVLFHLSHFLFFKWKNSTSPVLQHPSQVLYQLSYRHIVTPEVENYLFELRISKTKPQTSRQSWL